MRAVVVDFAYGEYVVDGTARRDIRYLLDRIDAETIVLDGESIPAQHEWRSALADAVSGARAGGARPVVIGYPSTWGSVRSGVLAEAAAGIGGDDVTLLPRAVLIARSHTDETVQRCAVVETTHVPRYPVDPLRPEPPAWDVQIMRRTARGWGIERSGVLEPAESAQAPAGTPRVEALIDDAVEAVFVDGADPAEVRRAIDMVSAHAVAGRVVPVDRALLRRSGWRTGRPEEPAEPAPIGGDVAVPERSRRARWVWPVAAAVAVVIALGALGVGWWQRGHTENAPRTRTATVDRTTLVVPGDWRQSGQPAPSADSDPSVTQSRTVFADPDDDARILLIQSVVRAGSTPASVATSLANRIRQRGDDVVTEFSPSTRFGGRDVISYREAPASGSPIRWYVLVGDGLQVSIGCQAGTGTGEQTLDGACREAVATTRIAGR